MHPLSWVEISRSALLGNRAVFRALAGPDRELLPVVKADAYGHGLAEVSRLLAGDGQRWFGVHSAGEALALAAANPDAELQTLILSWAPPELLAELLDAGARFTIFDREGLEQFQEAGAALGRRVSVHLKVETGVHRQGFMLDELEGLAARLAECDAIEVEGVHSHFANIEDVTDHGYAREQMRRFEEALSALEAGGVRPRLRHQSCTAAAILFPEIRQDLMRVGIGLYGHWPSRETLASARATGRNDLDLRPAMTWKARIVQVKTIPAGSYVGYGCSWKAESETRLGVLPIGYSDGYDRGLEGAHVLVRGRRAPVRGRVMMNLTLIDLSHLPEARRGDEAVLLGRQGDEEISAEDLAGRAGTINYEILARAAIRLPRRVED